MSLQTFRPFRAHAAIARLPLGYRPATKRARGGGPTRSPGRGMSLRTRGSSSTLSELVVFDDVTPSFPPYLLPH
jgi:hypothetical protein